MTNKKAKENEIRILQDQINSNIYNFDSLNK